MKKKTGSKPTKPFQNCLILRDRGGIVDRYKSFYALYKDLREHRFTISELHRATLSHGDFRRSDEIVGLGYTEHAPLSLRWCTGEPALEGKSEVSIYLADLRLRRGKKKTWTSKKRHKKHSYRSTNRVTKVFRHGMSCVAEEGEPPVRRYKDGYIPRYEDWYDRWTSKSWKDQSKYRKQWQKRRR